MRKRLIFLFTLLGGLYYFVEFVLPPYLPTSVPTITRFMDAAARHGGAAAGDGVATFGALADAASASRDLGIPLEAPPALAARAARVEWVKTGKMLGHIGVHASVDLAGGDPDAIPDWTREDAQWASHHRTFESVQTFAACCAEAGGTRRPGEAVEFDFPGAAAAVAAGRRLGLDIAVPAELRERPARLLRQSEGRVTARLRHAPADAADALPGWTVEKGFWTRTLRPHGYLMIGGYHEAISDAFIVIFVAAIGLGLVNIFLSHGTRIVMRRKGWLYSSALLLALAVMTAAGFYDWYLDAAEARTAQATQQALATARARALDGWETSGQPGARPAAEGFADLQAVDPAAHAAIAAAQPSAFARNMGTFYKQVLMGLGGLFTGLQSAMFSLLALYIAAAAYRAFRIRSGEAVLMMCTALLVMLGQIPMGVAMCDPIFQALGLKLGIVGVRGWIMEVINTAAFRGIYFGASIAWLAMGIRMWLSMESGTLYKD